MSTTRKDLVLIASELRNVRPDMQDSPLEYIGWENAVEAIADALHVTTGLDLNGNRKFDRERFYAATEEA